MYSPIREGYSKVVTISSTSLHLPLFSFSLFPEGCPHSFVYIHVTRDWLLFTCMVQCRLVWPSWTSGISGYLGTALIIVVLLESTLVYITIPCLCIWGTWMVVDRACSMTQQQQVVVLSSPLYFAYCPVVVKGSTPSCI
jgi:hypothetical protein